MEGRVRKYRQQQQQPSPDKAEVWKEMSNKYQQRPQPETEPEQQSNSRKVPVVYYLCRNRQLEHPHFIEVPLVSPDGLYLRDVIEKFNALRGRGMASMYSWACKRSYKNAFVWHDLCEDDLILPAHGNEYVLKGSELVKESNSGHSTPAGNLKLQNIKQLSELSSTISHDDSSSSTIMSARETKHSQDSSSSDVSPQSRGKKQAVTSGCLSLTEYKIHKKNHLADASTQTDEYIINKDQEISRRSVSTDNGSLESHIQRDPSPPSSSSACSSFKTDTLESLIKADINKSNSSERLEEEEEEYQIPINTKLTASNILLQLISCGSISSEDHNFGQISSYRPRFLDSTFLGMKLEDKEYFSGSLVETKSLKKEGVTSLKRSSSYSTNRMNKSDSTPTRTKCIPISIKASLSKHPRSASMRSYVSEGPRISSEGVPSSRILSPCPSNSSSKRITLPSLSKKQSKRMDKENVIKIVERLSSGARVIIRLEAHCDSKGNNPAIIV